MVAFRKMRPLLVFPVAMTGKTEASVFDPILQMPPPASEVATKANLGWSRPSHWGPASNATVLVQDVASLASDAAQNGHCEKWDDPPLDRLLRVDGPPMIAYARKPIFSAMYRVPQTNVPSSCLSTGALLAEWCQHQSRQAITSNSWEPLRG